MDSMKHEDESDDGSRFIIRARGLPWSVSAQEIMGFFSDAEVLNGEEGVHITYTREGRPSGECFVELASHDDLQKALGHNNEHMGKRYIEVFESKYTEMEWVIKKANPKNAGDPGDAVVRLRGLPFGCSKQDIATFFAGLEIVPYGITITLDQDGRCTGDAFVEFTSPQEAEKALQKHKEKIGHRYIEIFKSSKADIKYVVGPKLKPLMSVRPTPYDRPTFGGRARGRGANFGGFGPSGFSDFGFDEGYGGPGGFGGSMGSRGRGMRGGRGGMMQNRRGAGGKSQLSVMNSTTGHSVHMRGLPFEATEQDIHEFFTPLNPVQVRLIYEPSGRPKGEADVDFATHEDATAAMQKDKQHMGHRYIELFLQSSPGGGGSWAGQSNRGGGYSKGGSGYGMNGSGTSVSGNGSTGYGGGYGTSRYNNSSYGNQGGGSGSGTGSGFGQNSSYGGYQGSSSSYGGSGGGSGSGIDSRSGYGYGSGNQNSFASDITYPHVGTGGFFGGQNNYR